LSSERNRVLTGPVQPSYLEKKAPSFASSKRNHGGFQLNFANRYNLNLKPLQMAATPAQKKTMQPETQFYIRVVEKGGLRNFASHYWKLGEHGMKLNDCNYALAS